ncbi:hypothetical protein QNN00_19440 [Bacillus velezensis]|nr:hypothetical protein [Bacillus velezensis]
MHTLKCITRFYIIFAYFTVRADDFDIDTMIKGSTAIRAVMDDISSKGLDASPKEKTSLPC